MGEKDINKANNPGIETTDKKSVVSNHANTISTQTSDILELSITHPIVKAIYKFMTNNISKIYSKINKKQVLSIEFKIPDYEKCKKSGKCGSKKEFFRAVRFTVDSILGKLKITPKWISNITTDDEMIITGYENNTREKLGRQIRLTYTKSVKSFEVIGVEARDDKCNNVEIIINYNPYKGNEKKEDKQSKHILVNNDTKLLEIQDLIMGREGKDIYGKKIKSKKVIETKEGINIRRIPGTNNYIYYSNTDGFIEFSEGRKNNGIMQLTSISIINAIDVPKLDFAINPDKTNNNPLNIKVGGDVTGGPYKFKGNLFVGKHIKANLNIEGSINATCLMGTPNKNISIKSSSKIETTSISHANIDGKFILIKNTSTGKAPFIGKNQIKADNLKISNGLIKGELIVFIGSNLLIQNIIIKQRITKIKQDIKQDISEFKLGVEQIEIDINENFQHVSSKLTKESFNELKQIFKAIKSLLYIEPFQIEKIMKFLNYIHNKHEFDFIWGYKIKFNRLNNFYENIVSNKTTLGEREEKQKVIEKEVEKIVICINGEISEKGSLKLYIGNKIVKSKEIPSDKYISKGKVKIYKKYSIEKGGFIDITKDEAENIFLASKIELS